MREGKGRVCPRRGNSTGKDRGMRVCHTLENHKVWCDPWVTRLVSKDEAGKGRQGTDLKDLST